VLIGFRRVSRMIYGILHQQQAIMGKIERGEILNNNVIDVAVVSQTGPQSMPAVVQAQFSEIKSEAKQSTHVITKPTKLLPRTARFDRWGFSAQLVTLPADEGTRYQAAVHISFLGRMYSVQLQTPCPGSTFLPMLRVRNIVPTDSEMTVACKMGDFDRARKLLTSGLAHGGDVTASGSPMLDVSGQHSPCT
jgi:hypothetical protein